MKKKPLLKMDSDLLKRFEKSIESLKVIIATCVKKLYSVDLDTSIVSIYL